MPKSLPIMIIAMGVAACAPSDQADSGDSTFAPSNTTVGTVHDGIPGEGAGSAMTDGETSTRGAISGTDAPTSARGSAGTSAPGQSSSGR